MPLTRREYLKAIKKLVENGKIKRVKRRTGKISLSAKVRKGRDREEALLRLTEVLLACMASSPP